MRTIIGSGGAGSSSSPSGVASALEPVAVRRCRPQGAMVRTSMMFPSRVAHRRFLGWIRCQRFVDNRDDRRPRAIRGWQWSCQAFVARNLLFMLSLAPGCREPRTFGLQPCLNRPDAGLRLRCCRGDQPNHLVRLDLGLANHGAQNVDDVLRVRLGDARHPRFVHHGTVGKTRGRGRRN